MTFQEKLQFLMNLTQTSNKELANSIAVDPSLISLLRTGRRKIPQNLSHVQNMAAYFARHSSAKYQRQAIAEMLDLPTLHSDISAARLEQILFRWLCGEEDPVSRLLNVLSEDPVSGPAIPSAPPKEKKALQKTAGSVNQFFFGDAGKLEAFRQSLDFYPADVYSSEFLVVSDESVDWLSSDYALRKDFISKFSDGLNHGMRIRQVMPSMNLLSRCVDSLRQWLPLYATGQVDAYFYPRLRDNLYSRSMLILPGSYAMISTSLGPDFNDQITLLTTDPQLIEAYIQQFYTLLNQCRPALKTFSDMNTAVSCFQKILYKNGDILQMVSSPSASTAPAALLEDCIASTANPLLQDTYRLYLDTGKYLEGWLENNTFLDMCRLPSAREILSGEYPVILPYSAGPDQPCYTPQRYLMHLRNILRLLEQYDHYHLVPTDDKILCSFNLITSEGGNALLVKTTPPALFLEIKRPVIVHACQEYLYRQAGQIGYRGVYREKTMLRLRNLIQELEQLV